MIPTTERQETDGVTDATRRPVARNTCSALATASRRLPAMSFPVSTTRGNISPERPARPPISFFFLPELR